MIISLENRYLCLWDNSILSFDRRTPAARAGWFNGTIQTKSKYNRTNLLGIS